MLLAELDKSVRVPSVSGAAAEFEGDAVFLPGGCEPGEDGFGAVGAELGLVVLFLVDSCLLH